MTSEELYKQLEEGIQNCISSSTYRKYLTVMSRFHKYSWQNSLLIALQCPTATYVAGYRTWQARFNRIVKKGEKAIYIYAPMRKKCEDASEDDEEAYYISGFRPVPVFDISQTIGPNLPSLTAELTDPVKDYNTIFNRLQHIAGTSIVEAPAESHFFGSYNRVTDVITLRSGISELQGIKTLIHETAHRRLHRERTQSRISAEVEAESVAFIVCEYLHLDTSDYSFPYIANWSSEDLSYLKNSFPVIYKTAMQLISEYNELANAGGKEKE